MCSRNRILPRQAGRKAGNPIEDFGSFAIKSENPVRIDRKVRCICRI